MEDLGAHREVVDEMVDNKLRNGYCNQSAAAIQLDISRVS